ncbi:MAG: hypothetical protein AB1589_43715 [Cyanobacteriota bacterium]
MSTEQFHSKGSENNTINKRQAPAPLKKEDTHQKLYRKVIAASFVIQAVLIGVRGNIRAISGDPLLDIIPSMIAQGVSLVVKATKESNCKSGAND